MQCSVPEYQDGREVTDEIKSGIQRIKNHAIDVLEKGISKRLEIISSLNAKYTEVKRRWNDTLVLVYLH